MKRLNIIIFSQIAIIALILVACDTPTPISTTPSDSADVEGIDFDITLARENLYPTAIQFLIDDSGSVESECGGLGESRYDFVNFILDIFRTSPETTSQNLYVGVSSFGNVIEKYTSLVDTQLFNFAFPTISKPSILGGSQNFSGAIQKSIEELSLLPVEKRYLIIVTDGKYSSESAEQVKTIVGQIADEENLFIYASLLCTDFKSDWNNIDKVDVFDSLDESAVKLLGDLDDFLPLNSILMSSENYQYSITVQGYYTSSSFLFWNAHNQKKIKIGDSVINDYWVVEAGVKKDISILPINECPQHIYTVENSLPAHNWLLFIKRVTFQGFDISLIPLSANKIEIVNNIPINLRLVISSKEGKDLGKWKDCFSAQTTWASSDNSGNGVVVDYMSCIDVQHLCLSSMGENLYAEFEWMPQFSTIGKITLTVKLDAKADDSDFTGWIGSTDPLNAKFKPMYYVNNSIETDLEQQFVRKKFVFMNIISPDLVNLYLVSQGDLDGNNCPFPFDPMADSKVYRVNLIQNCDLSNLINTDKACSSYLYQKALEYVYTFTSSSNVISKCQFTQLYFDWQPSENQMETTWRCNNFQTSKICEEVHRPSFLP